MRGLLFISSFLVAVDLVSSSCTGPRSIAGRNISYLYNPAPLVKVDVDYIVLNKNDSRSTIFWRADKRTLQNAEDDQGNTTYSFVFRYRLFPSYSAPEPLDSGKVIFKELEDSLETYLLDSLEISTTYGRNYLLEITLKDLNSRRENKSFVTITKSNPFTRQSFLLLDRENHLVFEPFVVEPDTYLLRTAEPRQALFAKFYNREFPIASPPFSMVAPKPFDFTPDKMIGMVKSQNKFILPITTTGLYQIATDEEKKTGGAVYYFGTFYPQAKMVMDLAMPLRFITTNEEYTQMMEEEGLKKSVDKYWLSVGGNPNRARELIRSYYQRVEIANTLFASYIEGWKTDRGMCYLVFGPPNVVNRSTATETWLYGEEGKYNSLSLTFTKVVNPFTPNDYRLNRSATLKTPWYRAVEFWRQGRVLTYK